MIAKREQTHPGLLAARRPTAQGPGPDAASLRTAYLDLLKLALCDLAGQGTTSVGRIQGGATFNREVEGEGLAIRSAGMDWPLHGLTMVGLGRLDDVQACVETLVADGIPGDLIETGTWRGGSSILMRATLDSLGADERDVWLADSFAGFAPDQARRGAGQGELDDLSAYGFLQAPLADVKASFARFGIDRGVRFLEGYVEQTLAEVAGRRWSLIRVDVDTHDSTVCVLESLYPQLEPGGYVVIDDYGALDECRSAVDAFRERHGITEPLVEIDWTGVRWRRKAGR